MSEYKDLIRSCTHSCIVGILWKDYLITGHYGGYIYVWNRKTGEYLHNFRAGSQDIRGIFVDSAKEQLITASCYEIQIWSLLNWCLLRTISDIVTDSNPWVIKKVFLSNSTLFFNRSGSQAIEKMNVEPSQEIKPLVTDIAMIIDFITDDNYLVTLNQGNLIRIWNRETGDPIKNLFIKTPKYISKVILFNQLIAIQTQNQVKIYSIQTESEVWKSPEYVNVNLFDVFGDYLLFYSESRENSDLISCINRISIVKHELIQIQRIDFVVSIVVNNESNYFLIDNKDSIYSVDFASHKIDVLFRSHGGFIHQVEFHEQFFIASERSGIFSAELNSGKFKETIFNEKVDRLDVYDPYLFGSVLSGNTIYKVVLYIWEIVSLTTFKTKKKIKCPKKTTSVLLNDNQLIFLTDQTLFVYNFKDILKSSPSTPIKSNLEYAFTFNDVKTTHGALIQDGLLYIGSPETGEIIIFDLNTRTILSRVFAHKPTPLLFFTLEGKEKKLISCSDDREMKIWNTKSMICEKVIEIPEDLYCTPLVTNNQIITASRSKLIGYNISTGERSYFHDFSEEQVCIRNIAIINKKICVNAGDFLFLVDFP